jgi:hypothetical protein
VVWGAVVASATVNFAYEYTHSGHNVIAGGYLALLSLFEMLHAARVLGPVRAGRCLRQAQQPEVRFGTNGLTFGHVVVGTTSATSGAACDGGQKIICVQAVGLCRGSRSRTPW